LSYEASAKDLRFSLDPIRPSSDVPLRGRSPPSEGEKDFTFDWSTARLLLDEGRTSLTG
jgi:hypothetical protein